MSNLEWKNTSRGFRRADFLDSYRSKCSLQKSSIATVDLVWLGVDELSDGKPGERMHIDQELAAELIVALQVFVDTGELPE